MIGMLNHVLCLLCLIIFLSCGKDETSENKDMMPTIVPTQSPNNLPLLPRGASSYLEEKEKNKILLLRFIKLLKQKDQTISSAMSELQHKFNKFEQKDIDKFMDTLERVWINSNKEKSATTLKKISRYFSLDQDFKKINLAKLIFVFRFSEYFELGPETEKEVGPIGVLGFELYRNILTTEAEVLDAEARATAKLEGRIIDKDHFYFYEYLNRKYTWGHLRCQIKGLWGQNSDQSPSIEDRVYKLLVVTARLS
ncbi:MAG: hypothetical protein WCG27_13215, partial [Pseudomonadota bacterium]